MEVIHEQKAPRRLYRSRTDRKLAGVCGGLADYVNIDATVVRVLFILLFFVVPYLIMWLLVPEEA